MELIKIGNKDKYIQILESLEKTTKFIELLQLSDDTDQNFIVDKYSSTLITTKNVSNWNNTGAKGRLYKFGLKNSDKEKVFKDLKKINSFFYNRFDTRFGETVEMTEFGYANIAFFDTKRELLFYTITHEGLAWIQS